MSIYSDKLAHVQVIIDCRYSIAQMCTPEDMLARYLGVPFIDDVIRHNTIISHYLTVLNSIQIVTDKLKQFQTECPFFKLAYLASVYLLAFC